MLAGLGIDDHERQVEVAAEASAPEVEEGQLIGQDERCGRFQAQRYVLRRFVGEVREAGRRRRQPARPIDRPGRQVRRSQEEEHGQR